MYRIAFCATFVLAFWLPAKEKTPMPKADALSHGNASIEGSTIRCEISTVKFISVYVEVEVFRKGRWEYVRKIVEEPTVTIETKNYNLKSIQVYKSKDAFDDPTKPLEPIDPASLPTLLKNKTPVMISRGSPVTSQQVKEMAKGTIILVLPNPQEPASKPIKKK